MDNNDDKEKLCRHCKDEGIFWLEGPKGKSTLYRCPYCDAGKDHPLTELPYPPQFENGDGKKKDSEKKDP